jgi:hypothetical protein
MENVQTYRDMASICRKRAVFDPEHKWKHLGDAECWEHLAQAEIVSHFRGRGADSKVYATEPAASANDSRWKAIDAAST